MGQQRKEKRQLIQASLKQGDDVFEILDITTQGMALEGYKNLDLNESFRFHLSYPKSEDFPEGLDMGFSAVTRRKHFIQEKGIYEIGVEFQDMQPAQENTLKLLMAFLEEMNSFWGI